MLWILFTLLAAPAFADSTAKQSVTDFLRELSRLEDILQAHPECAELRDDAKPDCAKLSDGFCNTLWSSQNRGNMKVLDGQLRRGKSEKTDFSLRKLADLNALAASGDRLPDDLAERAAPILQELKAALAEENDSDEWYRRISRLQQRFDNAIEETADARAKTRFPQAKAKKNEDRSTEEKVRIKMLGAEIRDQVLEAKYAQHPNWKRVEKTFADVKAAMQEMADRLPFPADLKTQLRKKVATVTLSLPYSNPASIGADESCGTTDVNAAYNPARNKFYVCAGAFNELMSPSALALIIAHELGHSIDINSQLRISGQQLPIYASLRPILLSKGGPAISCEKWKQTLELIDSASPQLKQPANRAHPLDHLVSCFASREYLQPFTMEAVIDAARRRTNTIFGAHADSNLFLSLGQPGFYKYGNLRANDKFMRPDLVIADDVGAFQEQNVEGAPRVIELASQALACQTQEKDGKKIPYAKVEDEAVRAGLFRNALAEAKQAYFGLNLESYLHCGETCPELVESGLAANAGENMADWYAFRTLTILLEKENKLADRREKALLSASLFCMEPGVANGAPAMALVEKRHSQEEHPANRTRQLSIFSKENAELLGCRVEDGEAGFSQCMP